MMLTNLPEREEIALQAYVDALERRFGSEIVEILLFGSKVRDEAHEGSDIDVAVILRNPSVQDISEARGLTFDILLAHGVLLSVRAMSQQGWESLRSMQSLFYRNVKRDSISLLSRAA